MNDPQAFRKLLAPGGVLLAAWLAAGCLAGEAGPPALTLDFEKYTLTNGLDVVLHVDRSDPIVAVAMTYHVGSAREEAGRTGLAHLFEHLLFLDSENLGPGGLDILINQVGGTLNGSTSRDRTNYYQVVPNDALEKILWAEADKLGFFINTVTEETLAKERQVVKNEKRQSVDNQPYGHTGFVVGRNLYPAGHPYHSPVIGSLADLDHATLEDVRRFHRQWYGPNNATLVVAGDFDPAQTRAWIERYFGEIPAADLPARPDPPAVMLAETRRVLHEDNFARLPALTLVWPGPGQYHPDAYPLRTLAALLADSKESPFHRVIVEERRLAPSVRISSTAHELGGEFTVSIRAFEDVDLDAVQAAVAEAFARFEREGVAAAALERVRAGEEARFYGGVASVLGKAFRLADYNIFAGDPAFIAEDVRRALDVTAEDVRRVYADYVQGRNFVAASFVPRGRSDLALADSRGAEVVEEPIVVGREAELVAPPARETPRTPSAFDRSVAPPFGPRPPVRPPDVWREELANGIEVYGIEHAELPLVEVTVRLDGGMLREDPAAAGAANLTARSLTEGTARRTPEELEAAIDLLGSAIEVRSGRESLTVSARTLARNFEATLALVEEILLEPRWDETAFERLRQEALNALRQQAASPTAIAGDAFDELLYGAGHPRARNPLGTEATLRAMTMEDLKAYYDRAFFPAAARVHVVGDVTPEAAARALRGLEERWTVGPVPAPGIGPPAPAAPGLYFVDVPGAAQSVIQAGHLAMAETDPDFYPATVMNFRLGGGGFASQLLQVLREQRGYTYGVSSRFAGGPRPGPFTLSTSVRSNVTRESLALIREILEAYPDSLTEADLAATRDYLTRSNARRFETLGAKLGLLEEISLYGFDPGYVAERERIVVEMTLERLRELARAHIDPGRMIVLVAGDARTQLGRVADLGFGPPVVLEASRAD